jgi:hypothetical protein
MWNHNDISESPTPNPCYFLVAESILMKLGMNIISSQRCTSLRPSHQSVCLYKYRKWQSQSNRENRNRNMHIQSIKLGNLQHLYNKSFIFAITLNLVVCILFRILDQVQGFRLTQHCFNSCLLFLFNNRYMFRSYDLFEEEISAWRWSYDQNM